MEAYTNGMNEDSRGKVLYAPTSEQVQASRLTDFARFAEKGAGRHFADYAQLHGWSVEDISGFWQAIWEYFDIQSPHEVTTVVTSMVMPGAHWFPGVDVNYARQALRWADDGVAVVALDEAGARLELSYGELKRQVASCRAGLARLGVGKGDRVAGYLPNCAEAVVAFLASASLGAIWSSCPPEFGAKSVLDRFEQIAPKVLIAADTSRYGGRSFDKTTQVDEVRRGLSNLAALVVLRRQPGPSGVEDALDFDVTLGVSAAPDQLVDFDWVEFEHPLWILYSSGTTGKPKPIVHGHGGILLEHCKMMALHGDLGPGDRFFWYSTTGWMMWNYLLGGLLVGATIVLYDGSPAFPDLGALWRMIERERLTCFGTSAPFIMTCRDQQLVPREFADVSSLHTLGSTGAPLPPEGFHWVYDQVSPNLALASVSGGTDLCTAFVAGSPWHAVRAGELQCSALGADVRAFDSTGSPILGELGELVITKPMPSMPLYFWGDDDGKRYHASYFEDFEGVWRHGDWLRQFADGSAVIYGRSDATLNRGGVRMGTSEFYRVVEALPEVKDSLVVELAGAGHQSKLWLFVQLSLGTQMDTQVERAIKQHLREQLSPRHVPDEICEVPEVPYTLSGKKLELPVKRILGGAALDSAVNPGTMKNPEALRDLVLRAKARLARTASEQ